MWKHKLVDFIIEFLTDIDSEISAMKLNVNSRSRVIAKTWLQSFAQEIENRKQKIFY